MQKQSPWTMEMKIYVVFWTKALPLGMGAGTTGAHNHARIKERATKGRFTSTTAASPRQPATLPRESEQTPHASTLEYTLNYFTRSGRPASSGSHTTLHRKLAEDDKQSLGARRGKGVSFGSGPMAFPTGISKLQCVEQEGPGISSDRSREDATERCYLSSGSSGGAVPEQAVSGAEKRWDVQAGGKFKSSKQVYDKEPFQDGGFSHPEGCPTERRLDVINRPQGCLLLRPNSITASEVTPLRVERQDIRVSVPTVRVEQCTQSFHKTAETDIGLAQATGSAHDSISGRHPSIGIFPRGGEGTCGANHRDTVTIGLCDQQGEITVGADNKDTVPGLLDRFKIDDCLPSSGKSGEDKTGSKIDDPEEMCLFQGANASPREKSATSQAVLPAPLCYRQLQMLKNHVWSQTASFEMK